MESIEGEDAATSRLRIRSSGCGRRTSRVRSTKERTWDDLPFGYSAPVGALNYNENVRAATPAPTNPDARPRFVAVENPTIAFADALRAAIVARGVSVVGGASPSNSMPQWLSWGSPRTPSGW